MFKDSKDLGKGWMIRFITYTISLKTGRDKVLHLICRNKLRGSSKMRTQKYIPKERINNPPPKRKTVDGDKYLPNKECKVMVIKILTEFRRMVEHSKNFDKEMENIRKYQIEVTELKDSRTEMKNTLEGLNSSLDKAEGLVSLKTR